MDDDTEITEDVQEDADGDDAVHATGDDDSDVLFTVDRVESDDDDAGDDV